MAEPQENPAGADGSLLSHLVELRNRLLYTVVAVGVVFAALLPFANEVYELLARPLLAVLPRGASMIATDVTSPFFTPIKLTLGVAIVAAVPFILHQLWAFVAPGLYRHERRLVLPLLVSSTVLFYLGMAFAYFIVFPVVFGFFVGTAPTSVTVMTDIRAYLEFVITMFFAFGIAFEIPVAVVLLARMGVIDPDKLAGKRAYVLLGVFVIAAVLTPPDVFSQSFLAVPMYLLFEAGLLVARRVRPAPAAEEVAAEGPGFTDEQAAEEFERHDRAVGRSAKRRRRKRE